MPKYPNFLAVWTKLETFYFQIFVKKRGNQLIEENFISENKNIELTYHIPGVEY